MTFCMDDMVPQEHMLRKIDKAINWNFVYNPVEEKYCMENGRPNLDPVIFIKFVFIQYLYGIKSMRQTKVQVKIEHLYFFEFCYLYFYIFICYNGTTR